MGRQLCEGAVVPRAPGRWRSNVAEKFVSRSFPYGKESRLGVNPSEGLVLQEDSACRFGDRGSGADAHELRKARRARGMKNLMPSLR